MSAAVGGEKAPLLDELGSNGSTGSHTDAVLGSNSRVGNGKCSTIVAPACVTMGRDVEAADAGGGPAGTGEAQGASQGASKRASKVSLKYVALVALGCVG